MGCCQVNFDLTHERLMDLDLANTNDLRITQEEEFGDLSLESHHAICGSKTDSQVYLTRSTSLSMHRSDLEAAFLQSPDKKNY